MLHTHRQVTPVPHNKKRKSVRMVYLTSYKCILILPINQFSYYVIIYITYGRYALQFDAGQNLFHGGLIGYRVFIDEKG